MKKHALLIAEKPSVSQAISDAYDKIKDSYEYDIDFMSAAGHLVGLIEPNEYKAEWGTPWKKEVLPIIPDKWITKVTNPKFYNPLKEAWESGDYDLVINAGDAGREGQLIQELIYRSIGIDKPILRFWADDNTEKTIIKALNNLKPNEDYQGLTDASLLRLYFDWLLGMNFSRAASLSLNRGSSLGRVMTPTLAMIVERDKEIDDFKPVPYYELEGRFDKGFVGYLLNPSPIKDLNSTAFSDKNALVLLADSIEKSGKVSDVKQEEKIKKAPTLYNLSDLQKDMSAKYKYTPAETLATAQSLYEKKFLSYPRTESKCITTEQEKEMPSLLSKLQELSNFKTVIEGILSDDEAMKRALSSKKYVDNKKVSDHPALLPTEEIPNIDGLSEKEKNVYVAVVKRLLSIFLNPYKTLSTVMLISVGEHTFKANGSVILDMGWKELYKSDKGDEEEKENSLPNLSVGDDVTITSTKVLSKETSAPKRYTTGTILSAMETAGKQLDDEELEKVLRECAGLGTAATRADILVKLEAKNYINVTSSGAIVSTDEGRELIQALSGQEIVSPELTARWEKKLKQVEIGEASYDSFYEFMIGYVDTRTKKLLTLSPIGPYRKVIGKCPICKKDFLSLGTFYCCEDFLVKNEAGERACKMALPNKFGGKKTADGKIVSATPLSETDIKALIDGLETKPKNFVWKDGKKSRTSLILNENFEISFPKPSSYGKCPKCGGEVYRGKKGGFYCINATNKDESKRCNFLLYNFVGKSMIQDNQIRELLEYGVTQENIKITFKSGKKSPACRLKLEETEEYGWRVQLVEPEVNATCPMCKGRVQKKGFYYQCENFGNSCKFKISADYHDNPISEEELNKLIAGGKIKKRIKGVGKNGKKYDFDSTIFLKKDKDKGYVIDYVKDKK